MTAHPTIRQLSVNGRDITIAPAVFVDGEPRDFNVDAIDGSVVILDPGDPDLLAANAFEAGRVCAGASVFDVDRNVTVLEGASVPTCPIQRRLSGSGGPSL